MLSITLFPVLIIMLIESDRLRLRQFTYDDLDDIYRIWIDPDVRKYLWDDEIISKEKAENILTYCIDFFQENGFGIWAIIHKQQDELIGFCGFRFLDDTPEIEIIFGISPTYWRMGLTKEAIKAAIRYGFEEHDFKCIVGLANIENIASWRVMEKAGMKYEKRTLYNNQDVVFYSLSRSAWQADNSLYVLRKAIDQAMY